MKPVRIGLIRHFEVAKPMPAGWVTSQYLRTWMDDYDRADIIHRPIDLGGINWAKCFSSDMSRAYATARAAFSGDIRRMPELREPEITTFPTGNIRLPLTAWRMMLRLAWLTSHSSQRAAKNAFLKRLSYLNAEILSAAQEDTLIVSHAGMMIFLRKELLKLGFQGPNFRVAENGKLYVFEKAAPPE